MMKASSILQIQITPRLIRKYLILIQLEMYLKHQRIIVHLSQTTLSLRDAMQHIYLTRFHQVVLLQWL